MRTRSVIRMHTVNPMQAFGWPFIIMLLALVVVLIIGALVGSQGGAARAGMTEGMAWNGAIFALLGPLIGFGFTSMGQYFPLALGLGITRREFASGVTLMFLANAVGYAVVVTIGKAIEVATGGFGLSVRFFDVFYTGTGAVWQTFVQTFLVIIVSLFLGAAITAAFLRWGQAFLWTGAVILALVVVGLLAAGILVDGVTATLLDVLLMGWVPWMGVLAGIGVIAAGLWLLLLKRAQLR
ncbi:hypothetical protein ACT3TZ_09225 [Brachybacterium sp. AOP25-B2-12]|uniref:hypothetical protein n=1 Tax=Brachybacterium sp. AOP25-B2-12 TaxID=3457710 RepID=UPI004033F3EC